ncbi:MAG: glycoside hydrolase family 28 protein [Paludibacter sp.]|nr:glycoside hydrolase family 28 protein [Paludibacter sp.]
MKRFLLLISLFFFVQSGVTARAGCVKINKTRVKAPFDMPEILTPDFENCPVFDITRFGALKGNKQATTIAIEKAVDAASIAGGGIVSIPEGEWLTGKVHLKSNVNLRIEKGAVLLFDDNPIDYLPPVPTSWEGMECVNYSPLIYAYRCKNIAITGKGTIKARMDFWKNWFARPNAHMQSLKRLYEFSYRNVPFEDRIMVNDTAHLRPHFVQFNRCENILIEGISVVNSPFWTLHIYLSKNIILRNLNVFAHGHNNDGFDPEMSQNILVENCVFDQGDDAIAVKSGRNQEAWRLHTPSKNIVIRNCRVKNGHQLLAIGSELSGGVENVFIQNCKVDDNAKMFHLVFIKTNERRGGYVKNIYVENIDAGHISLGILGVETAVLYQWRDLVPTYEVKLTSINNIYLKNIKCRNVEFISRILGQKRLPVQNVFLTNVLADTVRGKMLIHENVINFIQK